MEARNYSIGNFVEKVVFLKPVRNVSETGAAETAFVEQEYRLCEIQDRVVNAETVSDADAEVQSYSVVTWKVNGLTTEWRAEYGGDRYFIDRILNENRGISRYELRREDLCND